MWPRAAGAATVTVSPGQSIQAAVDAAPPGSTIVVRPGTYRESVHVTKSGITLRGAGIGLTVLVPGAHDRCQAPLAGICFRGEVGWEPTFSATRPLIGGGVSGFSIRRSPGLAVYGIATVGLTVDGNELTGSSGRAMFLQLSRSSRVLSNVVHDNRDGGIHIEHSPHGAAQVAANRSYDNKGPGISLEHASRGAVTDNDLHGNCVGLLLSSDGLAGSNDWVIARNRVNANNRVCTGFGAPGAPRIAGQGILVRGSSRNTIVGNTVDGHVDPLTFFPSGGISVRGGSGNRVIANSAHGNLPADIFWDGSSPNEFLLNDCDVSIPPGLCR